MRGIENRPRRLGKLFGIAAAAAAVAFNGTFVVSVAGSGSIAKLPAGLPNFAYTHLQQFQQEQQTTQSRVFADSTNHLIFEEPAAPRACTPYDIVAYDADTLAMRGGGCFPGPAQGLGNTVDQSNPWGGGESAVVAIDPKDRLLFFAATDFNYPSFTAPAQVVVISEDTLKTVAVWPLPSGALPEIGGLSWYSPTDELLLLTDYGMTTPGSTLYPPAGMALSAYNVKTGKSEWTWAAPTSACAHPLHPKYTAQAPYRSSGEPAIFLACHTDQGVDSSGLGAAGSVAVLKVPLASHDASGIACPNWCPSGSSTVTAAPYAGNDFLFDSAGDRGFMVLSGAASGITIEAYDGRRAEFIGFSNVGQEGDVNSLGFGLDPITGRLYTAAPSGLYALDGRRTPLGVGSRFDHLGGQVQNQGMAVLAPDARSPITRLVVPYYYCSLADPKCGMPQFTVMADDYPVTRDPAAAAIDANTYAGPVPPGASLTVNFGTSARAYGFHLDWVGSYAAMETNTDIENCTASPNVPCTPFGPGNRDLLGADIGTLTLTDQGAEGDATAFGDGNGSTAQDYQQCTNTQSLADCLAGQGLPVPKTTSQVWPFPDAQCSAPGSASNASDSVNGLYPEDTSSDSMKGSALTGTDSGTATASVHCEDGSKGTQAAAYLASIYTGSNFSVGDSQTSTQVQGPTTSAGSLSKSWAVARGITIDLGSGSSIHIESVAQSASAIASGKPGTAKTTRTVRVSDVEIDSSQSSTCLSPSSGCQQVLCINSCDLHSLANQINAAFPSQIHVSFPSPDDQFAPGSTSNGSPGGYEAVVQAPAVEQYGDHQFNGMPPGEATFLPAMRVVLYYQGVATQELSREVLDFAGVEDDAELGRSVLPAVGTDCASCTSSFVEAAMTSAGLQLPTGLAANKSASQGLLATVRQTWQRIFQGLKWLWRSPAEGIRTLAGFLLLGSPLLLANRRLQLLKKAAGGGVR